MFFDPPALPASGLPGSRSSNTLPAVDAEKTKGRTWNGYACPGCRTVFRVAADFIGAEVMCPLCNETLRLPKTPEQVRPPTASPESSSAAVPAANPTQDTGPSVPPTIPFANGRRLKLALALLLPLTIIYGALLLFPQKKSPTESVIPGKAPASDPPAIAQEKPAPPPPPVAVSEMPVPPPPALQQPEEKAPVPEVALVQPVPETKAPIAEAVAEEIESAPLVPEPSPEPAAALPAPDSGLVEAIPATPAPEPTAPPPAVRPEPEPAAAPAELVHTIVRGDTLSKLSRKYQVGIATIKKANGMKSDAVMFGQKLKIPGAIEPAAEPAPPAVAETPAPALQAPRSHTVVRGDTLERIARKYGVEPRAIMQANRMKNDVVQLGRKLVVPAAP